MSANQKTNTRDTFARRKKRLRIARTSIANLAVLENAHTGVGGPEVDADGGLLGHDDVVLVSVEGGRGGVVQGVGVCLDAWAGLSGVEAGAAYRPPVEPPRTFD